MDPRPCPIRTCSERIPRTRGDGPPADEGEGGPNEDSPHTRGWTVNVDGRPRPLRGFPAHAGMDPRRAAGDGRPFGIPRTRGDGPRNARVVIVLIEDSPHTRGWTLGREDGRTGVQGFPAHAGMDPGRTRQSKRTVWIPRTRGDGPRTGAAQIQASGDFPAHAGMDPTQTDDPGGWTRIPRTRGDGPCGTPPPRPARGDSPHTRGWTPSAPTPSLASSRIPRTRGDGPLPIRLSGLDTGDSPHTRGWTQNLPCPFCDGRGFPAHAGMDPAAAVRRLDVGRIPPHTRGWTRDSDRRGDDGTGFPAHAGMDPAISPPPRPDHGGFPAHAGMDPDIILSAAHSYRIPRTRGDGPVARQVLTGATPDSPHTRGWTPRRGLQRRREGGFPAHAGMDPCSGRRCAATRRIPRTRGDGPKTLFGGGTRLADSPHTRGWTPDGRRDPGGHGGFPAHAGMDPTGREWNGQLFRDSPHTRGWTQHAPPTVLIVAGFPAHAGMDPRWPGRKKVARADSPHTRGMDPHVWMPTGPGIGIPRTRGDGPAVWPRQVRTLADSPHTRGWTRRRSGVQRADDGFPAHAGMDPRPARSTSTAGRGFPAHAGMDPPTASPASSRTRIPRTRGDGPSAHSRCNRAA